MSLLATTRMSSKGQVVIPEDVRKSLNLKTGDQFVVIGRGDAVILKTISAPAFEEFTDMLDEAQKQAKTAGLKRSDLARIIKDVRASK
jgi:AbrB family looped-hinge helix DNA binding protein